MKLKYLYILLTVLVFSGCSKDLDVDGAGPDFKVSTEKTTYKVGEPVDFKFEGDAGIISFYSGELQNDYAFKEGRIVPPGEISLSFTSSVNFGAQANQFSVLLSSDYNGKNTIDDIKAATWTDISNRFTLATNATYISSGAANISDLMPEGKPVYVVLRYIYDPAKPGAGRTWSIRTFSIKSNTIIGERVIADQNSAGFGLYYFGPKEATGRSGITTTTITLRANAVDRSYTEDWCISQPFQGGAIDLGPDRPIAIKGNSESKMDSYQYTYTQPGTYKAYFVATDATIADSKTIVKEVDITVVP